MTAHFLRPASLALIAVFCAAASPSPAQRPARIVFGGDSLARLTGRLSEKSRAAAESYLTGGDSAAREAVRALRLDSAAVEFLLAAVAKEPRDSIRLSMLATMRFTDFWAA